MGGFDRAVMCRALKKHGWIEIEDDMLMPPDSLWKEKPKSFYVDDAVDLQLILGDPGKDGEDFDLYNICPTSL